MAGMGMRASSQSTDPERIQLSLHDLSRTRKGLYAQLGEEIYQRSGDDLPLRDELSAIYDALERIDAEERSLKMTLSELRRPAYAQPSAASERQERQPYAPAERQERKPLPHTQAPVVQQGGLTATGTVIIDPPRHEEVSVTPQQSVPAAPMGRTCPQCGSPVPVEDSFCTNCGTRMEVEAASVSDAAASHAQTAPAAVEVAKSVRYCVECGKPVEAEDRFCIWCGTPLASWE